MGEDPKNVFVVGCPSIDIIKELDLNLLPNFNFSLSKPYLLVVFHSVTTDPSENNVLMAESIIKTVEELNIPTIFLGSNVDAGSKELGLVIKKFIEKRPPFVYSAKLLSPDIFYRVLAKAACAIGNSSSFIREGAFLGTPAVIVGSRQHKRERGENVKEVAIETKEIKKAVMEQIKHGPYPRNLMFGAGDAGQKIAEILAKAEPKIQKKFFDLKI